MQPNICCKTQHHDSRALLASAAVLADIMLDIQQTWGWYTCAAAGTTQLKVVASNAPAADYPATLVSLACKDAVKTHIHRAFDLCHLLLLLLGLLLNLVEPFQVNAIERTSNLDVKAVEHVLKHCLCASSL
jgi:hypothetical protein